ncbi:MAG: hypothetical protein ACRDQ5_24535 [Sciscionella sp.]
MPLRSPVGVGHVDGMFEEIISEWRSLSQQDHPSEVRAMSLTHA